MLCVVFFKEIKEKTNIRPAGLARIANETPPGRSLNKDKARKIRTIGSSG